MRIPRLIPILALSISTAFACSQAKTPAFDVASVRPSHLTLGPDYNNQIAFTVAGFNATNITLKRLIAEAWNVQLNQVVGPGWMGQNEYDIGARTAEGTTREQMRAMLKSLLAERFKLIAHAETREMYVYALVAAKAGPEIRAVAEVQPVNPASGFHFRGSMRQFADLLAVQFSIPAAEDPGVPVKAGGPPILVLDKTGLDGIFDFSVDMHPELGTDALTAWKRALEDQLGLGIESQKADVPVVVVDDAARIPTEN